jgi:hypothetical protein
VFQGDDLLVVDPRTGEQVVAVGSTAADQAIPLICGGESWTLQLTRHQD